MNEKLTHDEAHRLSATVEKLGLSKEYVEEMKKISNASDTCENIGIQIHNHVDSQYFDLLNKILNEGKWKGNRTGVDCLTIAGFMFEHDMSEGFPLLTTRKLPFKSTKVELEFFIKGLRSKKWLTDRGCHYWDGWCNPQKVPYANDEETKKKMAMEDDLGLIYGTQWRDFHDPAAIRLTKTKKGHNSRRNGMSVDQLKSVVDTLKKNPMDRRMICSAWNPLALSHMSLPSCHYSWQVTVIDGYLNLAFNMRSIDVCCGLSQNIPSYALLLHLLAKESGLKEGKLIGFLMDCHIYANHMDGVKKQLTQEIHKLPTIKTDKFTSIFDWTYEDTELIGYKHSEPIKYEVAI
jgi:thymidylate synthase